MANMFTILAVDLHQYKSVAWVKLPKPARSGQVKLAARQWKGPIQTDSQSPKQISYGGYEVDLQNRLGQHCRCPAGQRQPTVARFVAFRFLV